MPNLKTFTLTVNLETTEMERLILENLASATVEAVQQIECLKDAADYHRGKPGGDMACAEAQALQRDVLRLQEKIESLREQVTLTPEEEARLNDAKEPYDPLDRKIDTERIPF